MNTCFCYYLITAVFLFVHQNDVEPTIDGYIENLWHQMDSIIAFTQWMPNEGDAPSESTRVYIGFSKKYLFIAFQCFDSHPESIDTRIVKRDSYEL